MPPDRIWGFNKEDSSNEGLTHAGVKPLGAPVLLTGLHSNGRAGAPHAGDARVDERLLGKEDQEGSTPFAGSETSMTRFIQIGVVASGENRTCSPVGLTSHREAGSRFSLT